MVSAKNCFELLKRNRTAAIVILGCVGLLLILLSSFLPGEEKEEEAAVISDAAGQLSLGEQYRRETEKRLEELLEKVEGAGNVEVCITVGTGQRYVYAAEGKVSSSDNKREEEEKYVIVGSGSDRTPLIEKVETPEIIGAVILCQGGGDPAVAERMYKAASAALGIPTMNIFVTTMS
ncbi:MAG: hypothetical protein NC093_06295 [Alistipes sp.]|nr:hypothetical protein [Alistipes sp.]